MCLMTGERAQCCDNWQPVAVRSVRCAELTRRWCPMPRRRVRVRVASPEVQGRLARALAITRA